MSLRSFMSDIIGKISGKGKAKAEASSNAQFINYAPFYSGSDADKNCNATYQSAIQAYENAICKITPTLYYGERPCEDTLNYVLSVKPNDMQNAVNFWKQFAKSYFSNNIAIIWIEWDFTTKRRIKNLWIVDPIESDFEIKSYQGKLYLSFTKGDERVTDEFDDFLIHTYSPSVENPYVTHSSALTQVVNVIDANYTGLQKSLAMANVIRFIAYGTQTLSKKDLIDRQKKFQDLMQLVDGNGLLYVDNAQSVSQVNQSAKWQSPEDIKELKNQILSYFQIPESVCNKTATDDVYQSWVEGSIEPITMEIEDELNAKILTPNERSFGNKFRIDADKIYTASQTHRLEVAKTLIDSGKYYPNEVRKIIGVPLLEDSDNVLINRLDRVQDGSNAGSTSSDGSGSDDENDGGNSNG